MNANLQIEEIILQNDKRGVSELKPYVPNDFCTATAEYLLQSSGDVIITTGFYILSAGQHETDGPPAAIAIGNALQALGRNVIYVSDNWSIPVLLAWAGGEARIVEFPIETESASTMFAENLLDKLKPGLLLSIERCGRTSEGSYLNMRGLDITEYTAKIDYLFDYGLPSIGIGDGGNEIGMGNLIHYIPEVATLPNLPAVSRVDKLILASVSNWGGYGLVGALSKYVGKDLLPSNGEVETIIRHMVAAGAVDGTSGENKDYVDGFSLNENIEHLECIRHWIRNQ